MCTHGGILVPTLQEVDHFKETFLRSVKALPPFISCACCFDDILKFNILKNSRLYMVRQWKWSLLYRLNDWMAVHSHFSALQVALHNIDSYTTFPVDTAWLRVNGRFILSCWRPCKAFIYHLYRAAALIYMRTRDRTFQRQFRDNKSNVLRMH
jgi:hypothetical protein